ncbi:glycosyltransferase [Enterovibrio sp. ZSDZ35]|uniref:Glycosyltransferase n=1 Tax=Enterovibrio qingdaonensis TaxID=2899818 RepID=A0ABT5QNA8_9GAMM|nr:glycosyltransferase [Enterovibrio sp. ZSDZ35]MDD1782480.1 glycosyltransferase [Enterovibrio sp. ZSDZ35]
MSYPRVLITTYHQAFLVKGGGEHEMFSIAGALKEQGLIADIYGPYSRSIENYDAILHFSVHGGGLELLEYANKYNKPIFLWPNVWLTEKDLGSLDMIARFVEISHRLLFKSQSEMDNFCTYFPEVSDKCYRISVGADPSYLQYSTPDLFSSLQGQNNYAIWFGIIEPNKNQLNVVRAMKGTGTKLVLVGNCRDQEYLDRCVDEGGDDLIVLPSLPYRSQLVRSALSGAKFYIEVGHEPPGLSAIEAGLSGCNLVLSDSSWSREHFGYQAILVDPNDITSIKNGIERALTCERETSDLVSSLRKYCLPDSISPLLEMLEDTV